MPPKKDAGKGKGKGKAADTESAGTGKLKAAQSINVRHILVGDKSCHEVVSGRRIANRAPETTV